MSSSQMKCEICRKPLTGDRRLEVTLSCKHIFHQECAHKRLQRDNAPDCPVCRQKNALERAIEGSKMSRIRPSGAESSDDDSPPSRAHNPDGREIDDGWYEREMQKYTQPDIMTFVKNPGHTIFSLNWNAKMWLRQFDKCMVDPGKDSYGQQQKAANLLRHQLHMTVMLNTLSSIRHGRYFLRGREVTLNVNKKLKTFVYNHQSQLKRSGKMPTKTPFPQTKIKVEGIDCVVAYQNLVKQGRNPVLLNMANATSPGGGYRRGVGAQEENLFRRSDYVRSLDSDMDNFLSQRSHRFRCTTDAGEEESLRYSNEMYPMDEFGAIYTSGLTFFRHSQDAGYEYLDRPIENVCAIAMAAYCDPDLEGDLLARPFAVGTRKKIENIFSIAHHHGHDSIVLSAFGCGISGNPPEHITRIFFSVIEQYAGFFDTIIFAIIDGSTVGQPPSPHGNLKVFLNVLDGRSTRVETPMNKPKTMFGSYRVSSDGTRFNDINIFDAPPCYYAAKCYEIDDRKHTSQYSHPPLCARAANYGKCDLMQHLIHEHSFIHGAPSKSDDDDDDDHPIDDKKHLKGSGHSSDCPQRGACQNMDDDHLKQFRHVPLCKDGIRCLPFQKKIRDHCEQYRHCQPPCPDGNHCVNFHDRNHMREEKHPFPPPCPRTPFHCPDYDMLSGTDDMRSLPQRVQAHCLEYAHVCRFGRNCQNDILLHKQQSIHIMRNLCPQDGKCNRMHQEEHLNSYTHKGVADIRRICTADPCRERHKKDHAFRFRHPKSYDELAVARYYSLNTGINFVQNQCEGINRVFDYIKNQNWNGLPSDTVPSNILNWFRTVRPVHRCKPVIFESILLHGHCMSRDYMERLKNPRHVATSVMQHPRIRRIKNLDIPQYLQSAKEFVISIISEEFEMANFPSPDGASGAHAAAINHANVVKTKKSILSGAITPDEVELIRNKAIEIAKASIELHKNIPGVGHGPDQALGTHRRVFSILGPHLGHYYGDVFIVFKREILHHPDADYSMLAATTYAQSGNAYRWCPWLGTAPDDQTERIRRYHRSKLHASIPGHEEAIALQLMAITSHESNLKSIDIDLDNLLKRWSNSDSHKSIEAHLPQLIPLDYIERIYIPKSIHESLSKSSKELIDLLFKHCTHTIPDTIPSDGTIDPNPVFRPRPTTKGRADYQDQVINDLLQRFKTDAENLPARPIEGAVIAMPLTHFEETLVLPLTISQARELYRSKNKKDPPADIVYIYWQVIHGDMMLIVSGEKKVAGSDDEHQLSQPCLLCYIAPKHDSSESYHEQATYLNCGLPYEHHAFVTNGTYKARSTAFHLGSNTDDFITYCLEIHRQTGRVVLHQAGANAIYNHEEISYDFSKKELDVSKLESIRVSANAKNITIRNLIVCFERRADLHPTFDTSFKKLVTKPAGGFPTIGGGSTLTPCRDNINCFYQHSMSAAGKDHNSKYSHPCCFSELCRNKGCSFIHDPHPSPSCRDDKKCRKLTDPFHRAEYRHTDLPDFLIPCRDHKHCSDTSFDHRVKFSHGEQVFQKKGAGGTAAAGPHDPRPPCKYGPGCKTIGDPNHRAQFSHK